MSAEVQLTDRGQAVVKEVAQKYLHESPLITIGHSLNSATYDQNLTRFVASQGAQSLWLLSGDGSKDNVDEKDSR